MKRTGCGSRPRQGPTATSVFAAFAVFAALVVLATARSGPLAAAASPTAAAEPFGTVTEVARGLSSPSELVTGADGNLWFTDGNNAIGRMTVAGDFTAFTAPALDHPGEIVLGGDGNVWFVNGRSIGRITPAGAIDVFTDPSIVRPNELAVAADGTVWFTNSLTYATSNIGRVTAAGAVTVFSTGLTSPHSLTPAPDGTLWFVDGFDQQFVSNHLSSIDADGNVTYLTNFGNGVLVNELVFTPDGTLWITGSTYNFFSKTTTSFIGWQLPGPGSVGSRPFTTHTFGSESSPRRLTPAGGGDVWYVRESGAVERHTTDGTVTSVTTTDQYARFTRGPDGNLWFTRPDATAPGGGSLNRVTADGTVTPFADDGLRRPAAMVAGSDGNFWFIDRGAPLAIGRLTPSGVLTRFVDPAVTNPVDLAAAPDGSLWFTNFVPPLGVGSSVGRITTDGVVTLFTAPSMTFDDGIAAGPDGNVWAAFGSATIGRIAPDGSITPFTDPAIKYPAELTAGPDGNVWFTSSRYAGISVVSRITPNGAVTAFSSPDISEPSAIVAGPDGNVWFANHAQKNDGFGWYDVAWLARMTPAGVVKRIPLPDVDRVLTVAAGFDGHLWVTLWNFPRTWLTRVSPDGTITDVPGAPGAGSIVEGPDGNMWIQSGSAVFRVRTEDVPGPPGQVTASPGATPGSVAVSWDDAVTNGHPITAFTVTATPGGAACTWTSGPRTCTVAGLVPGATYSFTVTATNSLGAGPASAPVIADAAAFTDVPADAPFAADIGWAAGEHLVQGWPDGSFRPTLPVTRQAMAAFLYRFAGSPSGASPTCGAAPFVDVPAGAPFCGEIAWAKDQGIVHGYAGNTFHPTDAVSRQAMAAFLYRAASSPAGAHPTCTVAPFPDVPADATFCGEISWLAAHLVIQGFPDGTFRPLSPTSRQATTAFLHRLRLLGGS